MDGEGSKCLHNGHVLMVDERYTRANKMAAGLYIFIESHGGVP